MARTKMSKNEIIGMGIVGGAGLGFLFGGPVGAVILGAISIPLSNFYTDDIKKIMEDQWASKKR